MLITTLFVPTLNNVTTKLLTQFWPKRHQELVGTYLFGGNMYPTAEYLTALRVNSVLEEAEGRNRTLLE